MYQFQTLKRHIYMFLQSYGKYFVLHDVWYYILFLDIVLLFAMNIFLTVVLYNIGNPELRVISENG
jgi:hypothetical protein